MVDKNLTVAKTGNEAMAEAMRQINPDVVAAYPITPATEIAQIFAGFVADGLVHTEFVRVESEHSAMSAAVGAAAAGGRCMTATSSQGLMLMSEILPIASALRLPIVMPEVNRTIAGPINIHCDHSDTMFVRDSGWMQVYCEDAQEAYDSVLMGIKIAEKVMLPMMVSTDGFIISHCMARVDLIPDEDVTKYLGQYKPETWLLNPDKKITLGGLDLQDYYFEHKMVAIDAMYKSKAIIKECCEEFAGKFGRNYDFFESYKMDDAETAILAMGSVCGTAKVAVDNLRKDGKKVGLVRMRVFRPFPAEELAKTLSNLKTLAIMDRSDAMSAGEAPLAVETKAALYGRKKQPKTHNYVFGLGGRDIKVEEIEDVYKEMLDFTQPEKNFDRKVTYLGVRE
ncbi:MAG: pyruvate ferredoxin oxidoreductase [Candidatus Aureabacteria bacterium]|nr:pyruvate ferredoxin oxidoreductase [Candidatus Auribacterota bacterium]